jgi:hypothetical protein
MSSSSNDDGGWLTTELSVLRNFSFLWIFLVAKIDKVAIGFERDAGLALPF